MERRNGVGGEKGRGSVEENKEKGGMLIWEGVLTVR